MPSLDVSLTPCAYVFASLRGLADFGGRVYPVVQPLGDGDNFPSAVYLPLAAAWEPTLASGPQPDSETIRVECRAARMDDAVRLNDAAARALRAGGRVRSFSGGGVEYDEDTAVYRALLTVTVTR